MKNVPSNLVIESVKIADLKSALYNPRKWSESAIIQLRESMSRFGIVDPIIVNGATNRKNVVIGGHFRLKIAKDLGLTEIPVVYVNIADESKDAAKYNKVDAVTALKLITAVLRNDRFNSGALMRAFESGGFPKIIQRLVEIHDKGA